MLVAELSGAPIGHDELAGGPPPTAMAVGIFGVAWVAMVVAMMVPSSYPLVRAFAATIADPSDRPDRSGHPDLPASTTRVVSTGRLATMRRAAQSARRARSARMAAFLAGYLAIWTLFGYALLAGDFGVHAIVDSSPNLGATHASLIGNVLLVAGAFQLTGRKQRCLSRCRHPVRPAGRDHAEGPAAASAGAASAGAAGAGAAGAGAARVGVAGAGAARVGAAGAFLVGWSAGLGCLGSCWALMLAVFALGSPQLAWMALFGGLMLYETVGRYGALAARLAGAALLAASLLATLS
jgi:predicted metal-binding membrane protein